MFSFGNSLYAHHYMYPLKNGYSAYQPSISVQVSQTRTKPVENQFIEIDCSQICKECHKSKSSKQVSSLFSPIKVIRKSVPSTVTPSSTTTAEPPCSKEKMLPPYVSQWEESIRTANAPLPTLETDIIEINGIKGIWLNKAEVENWKGEIPLSEYQINNDKTPEVVKLKPKFCVDQVQELGVKYLKPPKPPTPGPIIIKQEANYATPAAPPIIIRQISSQTCQPPPIIIRERPPVPPEPIKSKTILIPGKRLPPPPRKVIIEKLPPALPTPQAITVERWLPYEKRERKVILEKKPLDPCIEKPKNVVYEWEPHCVNPRTILKNLGVENTDPVAYAAVHKTSLKNTGELPSFAMKDILPQVESKTPDLVGDLEGLKLIDLKKEGLEKYRKYA